MVAQLPDEELFPSLLDRLVDDSRPVERVQIRWRADAPVAFRSRTERVRDFLAREGYAAVDGSSGATGDCEWFQAATAALRIRELLDSVVSFGLRGGASLGELVEVLEVRPVPPDFGAGRVGSTAGRDLRLSIVQNLGWLLNTGQLMPDADLAEFPEVRSSVVNFGIPVIAGTTRSSVSPLDLADGIRAAILRYEPRLSDVEVSPVEAADQSSGVTLGFRIDARSWGPHSFERFSVRTSLDLETGRFDVRRDLR